MKCSKCQAEKPKEEFYIRNNTKRGYSSHCKICKKEYSDKISKIKRGNRDIGCRYSKNEQKIDEDSLLSWYIAGLLAADGFVYKNRVGIILHEKDIETIEIVKNFFEYSGPIATYNKIYKSLVINKCPHLIKQLNEKFNITKKKSLTLSPPQKIPSLEHALSFIVGYIDGDGCIYCSDKIKQLHILGTSQMLDFIIKTFSSICNISISPRKSSSKSLEVKQICLSANINGKYGKLLKILINLPIPKMQRKWNLIIDAEK